MADASDCRERSIRCAELASEVVDPRLQELLFDMARNWLNVALELERMQSFLDDEAFGLKPR